MKVPHHQRIFNRPAWEVKGQGRGAIPLPWFRFMKTTDTETCSVQVQFCKDRCCFEVKLARLSKAPLTAAQLLRGLIEAQGLVLSSAKDKTWPIHWDDGISKRDYGKGLQ